MRARVGTAAAIAAVMLLTGCTGTPAPAPETEEPAAQTSAADVDEVVETRTVTTDGGEIEVGVHPLVRVGEYVVLTADLVATQLPDGETTVSGSVFGLDAAQGAYVPAGMLRLIDAEGLRIHLPGLDDAEEPVGTSGGSFTVDADGLRVQQVYAAPEDGVPLGLLLPGDYIDELPVVEGEPPAPTLSDDDAADPLDVAEVASATVTSLDSITRQLDGAVQVVESTEEVRIDLSGDVLFEFGSAELGPDADAVVDAAVATLEARGAGEVDVVGHTDDVGDDASNQTLSEERADSVAQALSERVDTDAFDIRASGRGESEPLVANDSEENRQLNRRVTLTLTTQEITRSEIPTTGELPPFEDGPVATGAEGFDLEESRAGEFHVSAPSARRVGGLIAVTVEATRTDEGAYDSGWAVNLSASAFGYRGEGTSMDLYPFSPRLLVGDTAVYPLDYAIGAQESGTEEYRLAGDNDAQQGAGGGQTLSFVALYPDVAGADEITIENLGGAASTNYRLTDIPVE
ncbi:OmpA family protein [Microbacterium marinilacus]|nr:OmpA family protein [Microbacterium marinilacus]MBY0688274.1 OmpA family protein [Microbacterium marinilacus]